MRSTVPAALSQFIQRNNVIRWPASGINFTTTTLPPPLPPPHHHHHGPRRPPPAPTRYMCHPPSPPALPPSKPSPSLFATLLLFIVVALFPPPPPLPSMHPRCIRALLSRDIKAWRPYGLETLSSVITRTVDCINYGTAARARASEQASSVFSASPFSVEQN